MICYTGEGTEAQRSLCSAPVCTVEMRNSGISAFGHTPFVRGTLRPREERSWRGLRWVWDGSSAWCAVRVQVHVSLWWRKARVEARARPRGHAAQSRAESEHRSWRSPLSLAAACLGAALKPPLSRPRSSSAGCNPPSMLSSQSCDPDRPIRTTAHGFLKGVAMSAAGRDGGPWPPWQRRLTWTWGGWTGRGSRSPH